MKRIASSGSCFSFVLAVVSAALTCLAPASRAADPPKVAAATNNEQAEYRLGPEDVIEVFVYKEPDLSTTVTVRPDGRISLPLAGELDANGKPAAELQKEIAERLARYISGPVVN